MTTINKNLAFRRIAGGVFIVDSGKALLHELNGPAALIWEGIASGKSEEHILSAMVSEYEVDEKTAAADMEAFVKELLKSGLLRPEPV
jgi:hypothetical protein